MTTDCLVMPMMTNSSVAVILVAVIVFFALAGCAVRRVEPHINRADEMRLLTTRSSKDSFSEILRTIRWSMETNAKMGICDCYQHAGSYRCYDGELHYITAPSSSR